MKHKPDIEQLLKNTNVPKVTMDAKSKDRILFELLQQPTVVSETPTRKPNTPWWKVVFLPQIVTIGGALAVLALLVVWIVYTPESTQLSNTGVNAPVEISSNKNINSEVANNNTNSTPDDNINELPIEVVEGTMQDIITGEDTEYVAEVPESADINEVLPPRAERIDSLASLYLGLGGGHPDLDGLSFNFERKIDLSDASLPRSLDTLTTMHDSELHTIANVFNINSANSEISTFGFEHRHLVNIVGAVPENHAYGYCIELLALENSDSIDRCVSVSEYGRVDLFQSPTLAATDGIDEALKYITELTGYSAGDFTIEAGTENEYDIYYNYSVGDHLPLRDIGWHVLLEGGKLRALVGYIPPAVEQSSTTDTISSAEAYDRFVRAYEFQDITNPHFARTQTFEYSELVHAFIANGPHISMQVDSLELEYVYAENTSRSNIGDPFMQIIPVYRVHGYLNGTTNEFTVYVDATRSGDVFSGRFIMYNVGFVR